MDITYGADKTGLLCGYRFENGAPGVPVDLMEAAAWLQSEAPKGKADFVWPHFNLSDAAAEASIRKHLNAVPEFFEALHEGSRSTCIEDAHDTLIAVVNDVAYEFAFDPAEMASLWLNVGAHMALSARSHPLRSIDRLRDSIKNGKPLASSVSFLNHLLREQGDVLVRIVRDATVQVDVVEDKFLVGRPHNRRADLGKLRRVPGPVNAIYARCVASQKGLEQGAKRRRGRPRQGFATPRKAFLIATRREWGENGATRRCAPHPDSRSGIRRAP
jgi:zinc transporter